VGSSKRRKEEAIGVHGMDRKFIDRKFLKDLSIDCLIILHPSGMNEIYGKCTDDPGKLISMVERTIKRSMNEFKIVHRGVEVFFKTFSIQLPDDEKTHIAFGRKGRRFKSSEFRFLKSVLSHVCFSIHMWKKFGMMKAYVEKYRELAFHDPLTGAYTRHFFNEWIMKHSAYLKRTNKFTTFVLVDVNGMKKINDTYGHLKGDMILQEISNILMRCSRSMDLVIRYGGDEFLLVLPETDLNSAKKVMRRVNEILKSYSKTMKMELSVSYGMAQTKGDDYQEALNRADMKMYEMKKGFRGGGVDKSLGLLR